MKHALAALTLAAMAGPALADGTAVIGTPDAEGSHEMRVSWLNQDTIRMEPVDPAAGAYMVLRDGAAYSVSPAGAGGPMVMDLSTISAMGQGLAAQSGAPGPDASIGEHAAAEVTGMRPTGARETVAGLEGAVYEIDWIDQSGAARTTTAVLSEDPLAVELTQAFSTFGETTHAEADPRSRRIVDSGLGLLRFGESFRVASLEDGGVSAAAFELPAEPMDLESMMRGMPQR